MPPINPPSPAQWFKHHKPRNAHCVGGGGGPNKDMTTARHCYKIGETFTSFCGIKNAVVEKWKVTYTVQYCKLFLSIVLINSRCVG